MSESWTRGKRRSKFLFSLFFVGPEKKVYEGLYVVSKTFLRYRKEL